MATVPSCFFLLNTLLFFAAHTTRTLAQLSCESTSCEDGGLSIKFPFWLRLPYQNPFCRYPGFELSCTNTTGSSEPLVTFPESGDFLVKDISLEDQVVWINDPDECLPNRIMRNRGFNLEGSPFQLSTDYSLLNYSFLSCPSNLTAFSMIQPISCLESRSNRNSKNNNSSNNVNYSVVAVLSDPPFPTPWTAPCHVISWALIPVAGMTWLFWSDYYSDIRLQWKDPKCGSCEAHGGRCGFLQPTLGDTDFHIGCYDIPSQVQGLSRKTKYGLGIGLGIPGLLCIIGLTYFFYSKKQRREQEHQSSNELEFARPPIVRMGLDKASIEKYPKTLLGESGRLPKPNDNVCSICLCEYQAKETLRTIPECNHYFHANCVDGWLRLNATCPLCRNLPE